MTNSSNGLPIALQQFVNVLGLFVGSLSFLRPECTGLSSFSQTFALNVGSTFSCFLDVFMSMLLLLCSVPLRISCSDVSIVEILR